MSFSEMMESGRGPGVIGMLLALVVLAGFVLLYLFVFDEGMQGGERTIQSVLAEQTTDIMKLSEDIKTRQKRLSLVPGLESAKKTLANINKENLYRDAEIKRHKETYAATTVSNETLAKEFEAYKDDYRAFVRNKAKGQSIKTLKTTKGAVYENVTLREVTAIGAQIRHDGGFKRIPYEELPLEMQDYYQFDPRQKEKALAMENAVQNEHEAAVAATLDVTKEIAKDQKKRDLDADVQIAAANLAAGITRIAVLEKEIKDMNQAIRYEESKKNNKYSGRIGGISRAPEIRLALERKEQELLKVRRQVDALRALISD